MFLFYSQNRNETEVSGTERAFDRVAEMGFSIDIQVAFHIAYVFKVNKSTKRKKNSIF